MDTLKHPPYTTMFTLLILTLTITSSSTLQLPVREVLTLEDSELSVLDFIRLSYQPLLFPEALSTRTLSSLTPWTFHALSTSLEAATTFCVASKGALSHHDNVETEGDAKKSEETIGEENTARERGGKKVSKEDADTKETSRDVEKNSEEKREEEKKVTERRGKDDSKENTDTKKTKRRGEKTKEKIGEDDSGAGRETKKGRRESVEMREENEEDQPIRKEKKAECEEAEAWKKTEEEEGGKGTRMKDSAGGEGKRTKGQQQEAEKKKEIPMSLRRFGMEGPDKGWVNAFTSITKELGTAVTLPGVLKDADLAFLDLTRTGLRHLRAGWTWQGAGGSSSSARVVCVVEGGLTPALTPLPFPVATIQCIAGECSATVEANQEQATTPDLSFMVQAATAPRTCLYAPPEWQWAAAALEDTTLLVFTWEDDLVIKEEVAERLFKDEGEEGSKKTHGRRGQEEAAEAPTLWEALPKGSVPSGLLLWGDQNPLLHLLRRYLLSDRHLRRYAFLQEFQVDRQLMPDLVDCSRECQRSAVAVFKLLDADGDGELTPADATLLTHASFTALSHELDDLVDELNDLAKEQWEEAVEGPEEARSAFLRRARERLSSSATAAVRRWVAGDLEEAEEETLKEHLPGLHEQVLAARGTPAPRDKQEL